jgi:hypothetical protein
MAVVWIKVLFQCLPDDNDKNRTQNIGPRVLGWKQAPFALPFPNKSDNFCCIKIKMLLLTAGSKLQPVRRPSPLALFTCQAQSEKQPAASSVSSLLGV